MKTTLMPDPPINDMTQFKDWLMVRYAKLTATIELERRQENPLANMWHTHRLELIEVGKAIGLDLVVNKSLEEEK